MANEFLGCKHNLERVFVYPKVSEIGEFILLECSYGCPEIQLSIISKEREINVLKQHRFQGVAI